MDINLSIKLTYVHKETFFLMDNCEKFNEKWNKRGTNWMGLSGDNSICAFYVINFKIYKRKLYK